MITVRKPTPGNEGKVNVTFSMPDVDCCDCLYLVGWFDEWDASVYRMERCSDGTWSLTLELEPGLEYQYGYRTADGRWLPDPASKTTLDPAGHHQHSFIISRASLSA